MRTLGPTDACSEDKKRHSPADRGSRYSAPELFLPVKMYLITSDLNVRSVDRIEEVANNAIPFLRSI